MPTEAKYETIRTSQFRRDFKRSKKQGKDISKLIEVVHMLENGEKLPTNNYDHSLSGEFAECRECHLEPDWLLVYSIDEGKLQLHLLHVGTHSELF
ncbi:hypothetical protein FACS1894202_13580 [Clostridia bacterium]|nr:hypothetical protein FACS1894202_13580 [Clostridia bacterium]